MSNQLTFERTQGGVPQTLPGQDHISGLLFYLPEGDALPAADDGVDGFSAENPVIAISTLERARALGIKPDASSWYMKLLYYHLSEALRINPAITLYVMIANEAAVGFDFSEITTLVNHSNGSIRQIAVFRPTAELTSSDITDLQGVADTLYSQAKPVSVLYAGNVSDVSSLPQLRSAGNNRVSVVIGQDGAGDGAELYNHTDNTSTESVTIIGLVLGMVSLASVHESIAWVQKFPSGIATPALADGTLIKNTDQAVIEQLDTDGFLFLVTYPGVNGSYMNDSHTLDEETSEYKYIEAMRTIDKAERGIRTYLTPYLGAPLYVDPESGKLRSDTVSFLQVLAGKQLEDMEAAGELSGYIVEIDPEQDVLSSSTVEFVIKQVAVGVMRKVNVKIGYTTKTA